jgi:pimeloyl-ACP methyl ester carboxylesterase
LYYEETGAGRPVIFIHCPALSHIYWRPIMDRLAGVCRCIAIDIRGHGRSGLGDKPWTFADIADDVAMLTRELALEDAVVVGYSAGGAIALVAAIREPALYGGLIPVSAFSECCTLSMKVKIQMGLACIRMGLVPLIGPNIIGTNSAGPAHTRAMLPDAKQVNPVSLRCFLEETVKVSFTDRLHGVRIPVLLVNGDQDDWMHPYYRLLRSKLPAARSVFFRGVDHRVPTRQPELFADTVAEFLAQLDGPEPSLPLPDWNHPGVEQHPLH